MTRSKKGVSSSHRAPARTGRLPLQLVPSNTAASAEQHATAKRKRVEPAVTDRGDASSPEAGLNSHPPAQQPAAGGGGSQHAPTHNPAAAAAAAAAPLEPCHVHIPLELLLSGQLGASPVQPSQQEQDLGFMVLRSASEFMSTLHGAAQNMIALATSPPMHLPPVGAQQQQQQYACDAQSSSQAAAAEEEEQQQGVDPDAYLTPAPAAQRRRAEAPTQQQGALGAVAAAGGPQAPPITSWGLTGPEQLPTGSGQPPHDASCWDTQGGSAAASTALPATLGSWRQSEQPMQGQPLPSQPQQQLVGQDEERHMCGLQAGEVPEQDAPGCPCGPGTSAQGSQSTSAGVRLQQQDVPHPLPGPSPMCISACKAATPAEPALGYLQGTPMSIVLSSRRGPGSATQQQDHSSSRRRSASPIPAPDFDPASPMVLSIDKRGGGRAMDQQQEGEPPQQRAGRGEVGSTVRGAPSGRAAPQQQGARDCSQQVPTQSTLPRTPTQQQVARPRAVIGGPFTGPAITAMIGDGGLQTTPGTAGAPLKPSAAAGATGGAAAAAKQGGPAALLAENVPDTPAAAAFGRAGPSAPAAHTMLVTSSAGHGLGQPGGTVSSQATVQPDFVAAAQGPQQQQQQQQQAGMPALVASQPQSPLASSVTVGSECDIGSQDLYYAQLLREYGRSPAASGPAAAAAAGQPPAAPGSVSWQGQQQEPEVAVHTAAEQATTAVTGAGQANRCFDVSGSVHEHHHHQQQQQQPVQDLLPEDGMDLRLQLPGPPVGAAADGQQAAAAAAAADQEEDWSWLHSGAAAAAAGGGFGSDVGGGQVLQGAPRSCEEGQLSSLPSTVGLDWDTAGELLQWAFEARGAAAAAGGSGGGEAAQQGTAAARRRSGMGLASQTQSPLPLDPEVADLSFWEPLGAPLVCESFPFQKDAAVFADWCNVAGPGRVLQLQAACRQCNFRSFAERWSYMQARMATLGPQPQAGWGEPGVAEEEGAGAGAAAAVAAGMVALEEGAPNSSEPAAAAERTTAGGMLPPRPAPPLAAAGREGGGGEGQGGGGGPWLRVFTEEYQGRTGYTRRFLAASYKSLWRRMCSTPEGCRHFYEVIQEGQPCHLYFDLEYSTASNPGRDGAALVGALCRLLQDMCRRLWGLTLLPQWVLEMDSSTPDKFSRHLLVRIPGRAFPNNKVAGHLVTALISSAEATHKLSVHQQPRRNAAAAPGRVQQAADAAAAGVHMAGQAAMEAVAVSSAAVAGGGGGGGVDTHGLQQQQQQQLVAAARPTGCFVDSAVYSRNRHFRMLGSSKGGKPAVLWPTSRYALSAAGHNPSLLCNHQLWLLSLVCNVNPASQPLTLSTTSLPRGLHPAPPAARAAHGNAAAAGAAAGLQQQELILQYPEDPALGPPVLGHQAPAVSPEVAAAVAAAAAARGAAYAPGYRAVKVSWSCREDAGDGLEGQRLQQAAVAAIGFVERVATDMADGAPALVRTLAYCGEGGCVSYSLIGPGSHACQRVGRCHRSNHVFYVLDFESGHFCQKCHDPECSAWRSPWRPLPGEVWRQEEDGGGGQGLGAPAAGGAGFG